MTREEVKIAIDEFNEYFKDLSHDPCSKEGARYIERYEVAGKWRYHYELQDARKVWHDINTDKPTTKDYTILVHADKWRSDLSNKNERWKNGGGYKVVRKEWIRSVGVAEGDDGFVYKFKWWCRITDVCPLLTFDMGYEDEVVEF